MVGKWGWPGFQVRRVSPFKREILPRPRLTSLCICVFLFVSMYLCVYVRFLYMWYLWSQFDSTSVTQKESEIGVFVLTFRTGVQWFQREIHNRVIVVTVVVSLLLLVLLSLNHCYCFLKPRVDSPSTWHLSPGDTLVSPSSLLEQEEEEKSISELKESISWKNSC